MGEKEVLREMAVIKNGLTVFQDETYCLMGNVHDVHCIENLTNLCEKEGFFGVDFKYVGGIDASTL